VAIRLETAKGAGIKNYQDSDVSAFDINWDRDLTDLFPTVMRRTRLSPRYNCHGLIFGSRRTKIIDAMEIQKIISDDGYRPIQLAETKPGDIVLYVSEVGDVTHSGVIVEYRPPMVLPIIYSKWGNAGEFIHGLRDCPSFYGPEFRFYRCEP
jgi:hypothetical protein